jgi:hypothetical protein
MARPRAYRHLHPALKPDSAIVSGGRGIISELPTLRILRVMTIPELYNVIRAGSSSHCRKRSDVVLTAELLPPGSPSRAERRQVMQLWIRWNRSF